MSILLMDKLRELRTDINYTQKQVAEYLNLTRQGYAHYESGKRNPDYQTLLKLSILYDVDINTLINAPISHMTDTILKENAIFNAKKQNSTNKLIQLTKEEKKLFQLFRKLTPSQRQEALLYLEEKAYPKRD